MPIYIALLVIVVPILVIAFALGCGFIVRGVAKSKGRSGGWFWMGFWFDIIGIIIIACLPSVKNKQNNDDALIANEPKQLSNSQQSDKFDEIRKYKELLDEGVITQEEFEAKKKELL